MAAVVAGVTGAIGGATDSTARKAVGGIALALGRSPPPSQSMKLLLIPVLLACAFWGCATNPMETNNLTKDGRIYRAAEPTEFGEARSTINVRGATF